MTPSARTTTAWSLLLAVALFILAEVGGTAAQLPAVVAAMVILPLGENLHSVSAFELSYQLASKRSFGSYLGVGDARTAQSPGLTTRRAIRRTWCGAARGRCGRAPGNPVPAGRAA